MKTITYGDLFSGISCPTFALKQLGYNVDYRFACDIDKKCRKFLEDNHQPAIIYDNVIDITTLPTVDLMVMGFPCQPFSLANNKIPTDEHKSRDLYQECLRCIGLAQPKMFIMENVKGLLGKKEYFNRIIKGLESLPNYNFEYKVLNSKDYGTPQSRTRIWFIGRQIGTGSIHWPVPCGLKYQLPDFIDMTLQMTPFSTKSKNPEAREYPKEDGYFLGNGQASGKFSKYFEWPRDWAYCVTCRNSKVIYQRIGQNIEARSWSHSELDKLFGLNTPIVGKYSINQYQHFLGNGMDIGVLEKLISINL